MIPSSSEDGSKGSVANREAVLHDFPNSLFVLIKYYDEMEIPPSSLISDHSSQNNYEDK